MGSPRRALPPILLAAADIGVGGFLYSHVSALLGLLLLVCGLSVLITVAYGPLVLAGSVLYRHLSASTAE